MFGSNIRAHKLGICMPDANIPPPPHPPRSVRCVNATVFIALRIKKCNKIKIKLSSNRVTSRNIMVLFDCFQWLND